MTVLYIRIPSAVSAGLSTTLWHSLSTWPERSPTLWCNASMQSQYDLLTIQIWCIHEWKIMPFNSPKLIFTPACHYRKTHAPHALYIPQCHMTHWWFSTKCWCSFRLSLNNNTIQSDSSTKNNTVQQNCQPNMEIKISNCQRVVL